MNSPEASTTVAASQIPAPFDAQSPIVVAAVADLPPSMRAAGRENIPILLNAAREAGVVDPRKIGYILATAELESRMGQTMTEGGNGKGKDGVDHYFDAYEPTGRRGLALGNTEVGDGERFRGRGFVQVTGRDNYEKWSSRLGLTPDRVDGRDVPHLIAHPDALTDPATAARVMVEGMRDGKFTGVGLDRYINGRESNYVGARAIVNGTDRADDIAARAEVFAATVESHRQEIDPVGFAKERREREHGQIDTHKHAELQRWTPDMPHEDFEKLMSQVRGGNALVVQSASRAPSLERSSPTIDR